MRLCNADAGVSDVDTGIELPGVDGDRDTAALRGLLHCVVQFLSQRLRGPFGIMPDGE